MGMVINWGGLALLSLKKIETYSNKGSPVSVTIGNLVMGDVQERDSSVIRY